MDPTGKIIRERHWAVVCARCQAWHDLYPNRKTRPEAEARAAGWSLTKEGWLCEHCMDRRRIEAMPKHG